MGIGLISVGMLFLFNPFVNIVDILPDFIGYAFIIAGLSKISFFDERLRDARKGMSIMLLISAVKTFLLFVLGSMDNTMVLLITFAFFVVETIYILPTFRNLFNGFSGLGDIYGFKSVFFPVRRKISKKELKLKNIDPRSQEAFIEKDGISGLSLFTSIFFLMRGAISWLPEITALQAPDTGRFEEWSYFNWIFRGIAVVFLLPFAVKWIVSVYRYFHGISCDKELCFALQSRYEREILPKKGMLCGIKMRSVTLLYSAACLCAGALYIDYVNIFPAFISAVIFAVITVMLREYTDSGKERKLVILTLVFSALRSVSGIFSYVFQSLYVSEYIPEYFLHVSGAHDKYIPVIVSSALDGVFGCAMILCFMVLFRRVFVRHTSYINLITHSKEEADFRRNSIITSTGIPFALSSSLAFVSMLVFALHPIMIVYFAPWTLIEWVVLAASVFGAIYLADRMNNLLYKEISELN